MDIAVENAQSDQKAMASGAWKNSYSIRIGPVMKFGDALAEMRLPVLDSHRISANKTLILTG